MNYKNYIYIGLALALVLGGGALMLTHTNKKFGSQVTYDVNNFVYGIIVGGSNSSMPGCIKIQDKTDGAFSYIYADAGNVTASNVNPFGSGVCN